MAVVEDGRVLGRGTTLELLATGALGLGRVRAVVFGPGLGSGGPGCRRATPWEDR